MFNLTNLSFAPDGRLEARPPSNPYHSPFSWSILNTISPCQRKLLFQNLLQLNNIYVVLIMWVVVVGGEQFNGNIII